MCSGDAVTVVMEGKSGVWEYEQEASSRGAL